MSTSTEQPFDFSGDHLVLDFANTVSNRPTAPVERLVDWAALVTFARQAELVTAARATRLVSWGEREPEAARRIVDDARRLREALHRVFTAVATASPRSARTRRSSSTRASRWASCAMPAPRGWRPGR